MLSTQVVIIGAGPVGLLSAISLDRLGIPNLLVERRLGRQDAPKAHAVNPRTLEICQRFGVSADQIRAAGASIEDGGQVHFVDTLTGPLFGSLPYERQTDDAKAFTPWPLVNIAQPRFEQFLSDRLASGTHTALISGFQATDSQTHDSEVITTLQPRSGSEPLHIRSDYVIAADGAASSTRERLGIEMIGAEALQHYVMIHFEADLTTLTQDRPGLLYFCMSPDVGGVFIGYDRRSNWVYMHSYDPSTQSRDDFDAAVCRQLVEAAAGAQLASFCLKHVSPWTMSAQVAQTYRSGRTFLAGDAAHRFPPTGGLGLNTGIADAHNLTWKLAQVLKGNAPADWLDTYDAERRPVAEINSHQSVTNSAKLLHLFGALYGPDPSAQQTYYATACADPQSTAGLADSVELQRPHFDSFNLQLGYRYGANVDPDSIDISRYEPTFEVGDYLPHVPLTDHAWLLGQLPVDGFCLLTGPNSAAWADVTLSRFSEGADFVCADTPFYQRANLDSDGALLIRPDGHICARWQQAPKHPQADVEQQLNSALGH